MDHNLLVVDNVMVQLPDREECASRLQLDGGVIGPGWLRCCRTTFDQLAVFRSRRPFGRVKHIGHIAHAFNACVNVDGDRHCSVIVVQQGWVCESLDDSLHFSFLVFTPLELCAFLGECSQMLCVLEEHAGEGGQGGCTTQK